MCDSRTGTIEEKMYQRQLTKVGLSDALIVSKMARLGMVVFNVLM